MGFISAHGRLQQLDLIFGWPLLLYSGEKLEREKDNKE